MEVTSEVEDQRTLNMKGLTVKNLNWMGDPMDNKPNYRFKELNEFPSKFEQTIIKEEKRKAKIVSKEGDTDITLKTTKNFGIFIIVGVMIILIGYKISHP